MIEARLPGLLAGIVEDVDDVEEMGGTPLIRAAWTAGRVRRRRRMLVTVAAAVIAAGTVCVSAVVAVRDVGGSPPASRRDRSAAPSVPASAASVTTAPAPAGESALPVLETPFAALTGLPMTAPGLSTAPLPRVAAAAQRPHGPVLLLAPDGSWRQVDSTWMTAAGTTVGSTVVPVLSSRSISPDGRTLALTVPGAVVLVDVRTGKARRLPVDGPTGRALETASWLPDGAHVVTGGDAGTVVVSTVDGVVRPATYLSDDVASGHGGDPVVELTGSTIVIHDPGSAPAQVPLRQDPRIKPDQWYGATWINHGRIARTTFQAGSAEQAVVVIDTTTGRITHAIELTYGQPVARSQGCCATLGWLNDQTVLLRDGGQLLGWRPATGTLFRIARLPSASSPGADAADIVIAMMP